MIKLALPWIQIWSISTLQKIPEITQIHLFWKGQVQLIIKPEVTTILLRVQTPAKATITRFYVELVQRTLPAHLMRYQRLGSPVLCLGFNVKILNIIFRTVRVNARGKKTKNNVFLGRKHETKDATIDTSTITTSKNSLQKLFFF